MKTFSWSAQRKSIKIDISRVWEIIQGDFTNRDTNYIANLYWDDEITAVRLVSLLIHLESGTDYFVAANEGYVPRTPEEISALRNRKKEDEQNARAALMFMESLNRGVILEALSETDRSFLDDLKGYVVFGEEYPGCDRAKYLLSLNRNVKDDLRKNAFDLLVSTDMR